MRGSRRTRAGSLAGAFLGDLELGGVGEFAQAPRCEQALVDRPEAPLEGGVDGSAEGDGLTVHGAAGGDHEIGVGDQRLGVDGVLGDGEGGDGAQLLALGLRARQQHGLQAIRSLGGRAQARQDVREEVVAEAVVEGDLRRGAHDDEGS